MNREKSKTKIHLIETFSSSTICYSPNLQLQASENQTTVQLLLIYRLFSSLFRVTLLLPTRLN